MIHRNLLHQRPPLLRPIPHLGIDAPINPKTARPLNARPQDRKILTAPQPRPIPHKPPRRLRKMRPKRPIQPRHERRIIVHERKLARRGELRRTRRVGGIALGAHDALDGAQDAGAGPGGDGAAVELEGGAVRDDVLDGAGGDAADGDDGEVVRRGLARDDGLQPDDGRGGHQDGVDGALRLRGVPAAAVEGDGHAVGGAGHEVFFGGDGACRMDKVNSRFL